MTQSPPTQALSRSQVLIAMALTAVVLFAIAVGWMHLLAVPKVPVLWQFHHFVMGIALGGGVTLCSSLLYEVWQPFREAATEYLEMVLRPLAFVDLIWLGLLPGLSEELLFRGVALPGLGMNLLALAISSVIFGALHMASAKHVPYMLWATFVGFLLGGITLLTGNLLSAITAHIFTNTLSGLIWKFRQAKPSA